MSKKTKSNPADTIEVGPVVLTSKLALKVPRRQGTKYQPVLDQAKKLKVGESFLVPVNGKRAKSVQNMLCELFRRYGRKGALPKGVRYAIRTPQEAGKLAVCCVPAR